MGHKMLVMRWGDALRGGEDLNLLAQRRGQRVAIRRGEPIAPTCLAMHPKRETDERPWPAAQRILFGKKLHILNGKIIEQPPAKGPDLLPRARLCKKEP